VLVALLWPQLYWRVQTEVDEVSKLRVGLKSSVIDRVIGKGSLCVGACSKLARSLSWVGETILAKGVAHLRALHPDLTLVRCRLPVV
jgi:hypothetical protein